MSSSFPPPPHFGLPEQQDAWERYGANCGPGAIAAMTGHAPGPVAALLGPRFTRIGGTTEFMLEGALTALGLPWRAAPGRFPDYGLVRVLWDGPWRGFIPRRQHSHWIGSARAGANHLIFDINAISLGGWISFIEWESYLRPWLLDLCEPEATGGWEIAEAYEISLPPGRRLTP